MENIRQGFDMLRGKFAGPEGRDRMYGIGLLMSQLGTGQTPNVGPALQMLQDRQQRNALRDQMGGGEFMSRFSDEERAYLSTLPPEVAQELIGQRIFAQPAPVEGTEINGQLVNPFTGELMGDYRTPETPEAGYTVLTPEEAAAIPGLVPGVTYQRAPNGSIEPVPGTGASTSFIVSGDGAAAMNLDPNKSYNVTSGPKGMEAEEIGSGNVTVINEGDSAPMMGTIPPGYEVVKQADGTHVMRAIPGGPADTSSNEQRQTDMASTASDVVANAFTRASNADGQRVLTGLLGAMASVNPGSNNAEVYRQVQTLQDIASAEALNAMRQSSPTGGALGNVTERELGLLSRQAGALDPASPNFQRDLRDYTQAVLRTIHGEAAGDSIFGQITAGLGQQQAAPAGTTQRLRFNPATGEFE